MASKAVQQPVLPSTHSPSLAGSVIETPDGLGNGGTILIRIQNISSTGKDHICSHSLKISIFYAT